MLRVNSIQRFCLQDGPGIRTTVFLQGCPIHCSWCHNRTLRPEKSEDSVDYTIQNLVQKVQRDRGYWKQSQGGVTVSGGEPLMQADQLHEFLSVLKGHGHHTCVDTSATMPTETIISLAEVVDLWLVDLKTANKKTFRRATGGQLSRVWEALQYLMSENNEVWIRIPLINGFNTDQTSLTEIREALRGMEGVQQIQLVPGHDIGETGGDIPDQRCFAVDPGKCEEIRSFLDSTNREIEILW